MNINLQLPINGVSFGQVSTSILREFYSRGANPTIFVIGQGDLASQKLEPEFVQWLNSNIDRSFAAHKRDVPTLKLWHLNGALESLSTKQSLFTFYELDAPTKEEINAAKNNSKVIVSTNYTANVLRDSGVDNVSLVPLGFDSLNFVKKEKKYHDSDRTVFLLTGKFEKRKGHEKVIRAWLKKYGRNPKYFLSCAIYNPFLRRNVNGQIVDDNVTVVNQIMAGQNIFNIKFLGYMQSNEVYNDYLNSGDVVIGMGTEGWGLPEFHATGMGKYAVLLNCAGHKEWATKENSVLVQPSGKIEAYDNIFFHKGQKFNQGNIFDFDEDEFVAACETAIRLKEKNSVNTEGLKLQQQFTFKDTVDKLISETINL